MNKDYKGAKISANKFIHSNEDAINKILYFLKSITTTLTDDYKEFRRYSV